MKAIIAALVLLASFANAAQTASKDGPTTMPAVTQLEVKSDQFTCMADGKPLKGVLIKPAGDGPFPAVIVSHGLGGNARNMMNVRGRDLLRAGYVCIAIDYTHAVGPPPQRASNPRERFSAIDFTTAGARPENIRRALACLEVLRQLPYVDQQRITAYGHSMGAFLTIALIAAAPDAFSAAAITAGGVVPEGINAPAPDVSVAARIRTPLLILHGTADTTVRPEMSLRLEQILKRNDIPTKRHLFQGAGHNIQIDNAKEVQQFILTWFAEHAPAERPSSR